MLEGWDKLLFWEKSLSSKFIVFTVSVTQPRPFAGIRAQRAAAGACYVNCLSDDWMQSVGILVRGIWGGVCVCVRKRMERLDLDLFFLASSTPHLPSSSLPPPDNPPCRTRMSLSTLETHAPQRLHLPPLAPVLSIFCLS